MKKKYVDCVFLFVIVTTLLNLAFWGLMILTRSSNIISYFITDYNDTSMDFFNMLANLHDSKPYTYNANYPAFCFMFLRILYHAVPINENGNDGFFLREYMPAQLMYIIYTIVVLLAIYEIIKHSINANNTQKVLFSFCIILSGPMIFTLERGNLILLATLFLILFFKNYDSDKLWVRIISYVFLSISAAIKIYPALFGLLIVKKKRIKEAVLALIMGALIFFIPFFWFDGVASIKTMINGIFLSSNDSLSLGFGFNFSFTNLISIISTMFSISVNSSLIVYKIIPIVLGLIIFFISQEEWEQIWGITLICVLFPVFSYTYTLIMFIGAIISFFRSKRTKITDIICTICFAIIMTPHALPLIDSVNYIDDQYVKLPASGSTILIYFCLFFVTGIILYNNVAKRIVK